MKTELQAAYHALLTRKREIEVADKTGAVKCRLCDRAKSEHIPDGRCSVSALSANFVSVDRDESDRIEAALPPIEAMLGGER
jgi:hypothetical protein